MSILVNYRSAVDKYEIVVLQLQYPEGEMAIGGPSFVATTWEASDL